MILHHQAVILAPTDDYPLHTTAKRYWPASAEQEPHWHTSDASALTLILLHSTSFHKETWEPSLEQLFKLSSQPGSVVKIREAWALDCPNHGASSQLNEKALMRPEFHNNCTSFQIAVSDTYTVFMLLDQLPARNTQRLFITSFPQDPLMAHKLTFASEIWLGSGIR